MGVASTKGWKPTQSRNWENLALTESSGAKVLRRVSNFGFTSRTESTADFVNRLGNRSKPHTVFRSLEARQEHRLSVAARHPARLSPLFKGVRALLAALKEHVDTRRCLS